MDAQKFTATAIALLRSSIGWQSAIGRRLDVDSRTVRRWLKNNETPAWVDEKLAQMTGAREISPWPRDEWVIGDAVTADGHHREYIIHMAPPRFSARIVACEPDGLPENEELPADITSGVVYSIDEETVLCEIDWIDEPQPGEIHQLMEAAADAIENMGLRGI